MIEMKWSYKQQRRLLELARSAGSLEELADFAGRPPASVQKMALQLGILLEFNSVTGDRNRGPRRKQNDRRDAAPRCQHEPKGSDAISV